MVALARWRLTTIGIPLCVLFLAGVELAKPNFFDAYAALVLLPQEKPVLDVAVRAGGLRLDGDAAERAGSGSLMLPPRTELYVALLTSKAVLEPLAARMSGRVPELFGVPDVAGSELLRRAIVIRATKDGMLEIRARSADPGAAAALAQAVVEVGMRAAKGIEKQLVLEQSRYLERAVVGVRRELQRSESKLRNFYASAHLIDPVMQATDALRQIREVLGAREKARAELAERLAYCTEDAPDVVRLRARIASAEARVREVRGSTVGEVGDKDFGQLLLEFESLRKVVGFQRDLLATLQLRKNVLDLRAEQPGAKLAVIEAAKVPMTPAGPRRRVVLLIAIAVSGIGAIATAVILEQWRYARESDYVRGRLREFRELLRLRRNA